MNLLAEHAVQEGGQNVNVTQPIDSSAPTPIEDWAVSATKVLGYDPLDQSSMTNPWAGADEFWARFLRVLQAPEEVPTEDFAVWADVVADEAQAYAATDFDAWPEP